MSGKRKIEEPTNEELIAVQNFANKHGRSWKVNLSDAWQSGTDDKEPDAHLLRRVRNRCGPRWLISNLNTIKPQKPEVSNNHSM